MKTRTGQSLITVLVATALSAILMTGVLSMMKMQMHGNRQVAARGGVSDLSHALDAFFDGPQCGSTGIFLSNGGPAIVSVTGSGYSLVLDTLKFASGTTAATTLPDALVQSMIHPYEIAALTFVPLGGYGPSPSGGHRFLFLLQVTFRANGEAPPAALNKYISVYTDGANRVVGACYG